MSKSYKLGTSNYEFIAIHSAHVIFVKDKNGKLVKRVNENGVLKRVVKGLETVTTEYVTELFNNPNMYLSDTAPEVGRSLKVMERYEDENDIFFRGFVSYKDHSIRLTMDQHAEDVLASAKEGISFLKDLPALKNKSFR